MSRRWLSVVGVLVLVASGCTGNAAPTAPPSSGTAPPTTSWPIEPRVVSVEPGGTITVSVGERVRWSVGTGNESIGHGHHIETPPRPDVATAQKLDRLLNPTRAPGGCNTDQTILLTGIAPGETAITVVYCFRSAPPRCDPNGTPDRRTWQVKVAG